MTRALAAVAPSATQLQKLQLLAGDTEDPDSFDIAELVWRMLMCHLRAPALSTPCSCSSARVYWQPPTDATIITAQACMSHLRSLTNLTVRCIGTPFLTASLNATLACLPALQVLSLTFRKASDPAAAQTGERRLRFPSSLLR